MVEIAQQALPQRFAISRVERCLDPIDRKANDAKTIDSGCRGRSDPVWTGCSCGRPSRASSLCRSIPGARQSPGGFGTTQERRIAANVPRSLIVSKALIAEKGGQTPRGLAGILCFSRKLSAIRSRADTPRGKMVVAFCPNYAKIAARDSG